MSLSALNSVLFLTATTDLPWKDSYASLDNQETAKLWQNLTSTVSLLRKFELFQLQEAINKSVDAIEVAKAVDVSTLFRLHGLQ